MSLYRYHLMIIISGMSLWTTPHTGWHTLGAMTWPVTIQLLKSPFNASTRINPAHLLGNVFDSSFSQVRRGSKSPNLISTLAR